MEIFTKICQNRANKNSKFGIMFDWYCYFSVILVKAAWAGKAKSRQLVWHFSDTCHMNEVLIILFHEPLQPHTPTHNRDYDNQTLVSSLSR